MLTFLVLIAKIQLFRKVGNKSDYFSTFLRWTRLDIHRYERQEQAKKRYTFLPKKYTFLG